MKKLLILPAVILFTLQSCWGTEIRAKKYFNKKIKSLQTQLA
jgi:hypothetical protein